MGDKSVLKSMDRSEFKDVVISYLDGLYGLAYSMTRHRADAEDLVQETVLKAYRSFASFERGTNVRAWLFKILRNTFVSDYRKKKREPEKVSIDADENFSFYTQASQKVSVEGAEALKAVIDRENLEAFFGDEIVKAIDLLPDEFREAILLCDIQDLRYGEMAQILDVPIGTVRSRLARGRGMLQKLLWEYAERHGLMGRGSS